MVVSILETFARASGIFRRAPQVAEPRQRFVRSMETRYDVRKAKECDQIAIRNLRWGFSKADVSFLDRRPGRSCLCPKHHHGDSRQSKCYLGWQCYDRSDQWHGDLYGFDR